MLRSIALLLAGGYLLAQAPRYILNDLGPIVAPPDGAVTGINALGQVIGYEDAPPNPNGPARSARSFRTAPNAAINWSTDNLGTLGGSITRAWGINTAGQVVGESTLATGETRAFRTAPNAAIQPATDNLGTLNGSTESRARAINDSGQVTGSSGNPFLTAPNRAINPATDFIDSTQGIYHAKGTGRYINRRGMILGEAYAGAPFYPDAFVYPTRSAPAALFNITHFIQEDFAGITDQDQFVFSPTGRLMLWQNGKSTELTKCPDYCTPASVNNSLQVTASNPHFSYLYTGGVLYDLDQLIPNQSGWMLHTPAAPFQMLRFFINDLGQIAGVGYFNNEAHAVRLDPIPSVPAAIDKALSLVSSLPVDRIKRGTPSLLLRATLAAPLKSALESWNQGSPAGTRSSLNMFETLVRSQAGASLSTQQANQLLQLAEAAYDLT